jgi:hypothetical protein
MGITRKLLKLFTIDFDGEGEATKALIDLFGSLDINLWTPSEKEQPLILNMMSLEPNPEVVDNWQRLAVEFAKSFIARYQGTAVTPYMHVFVYHVGHFMKKLGSIESFANYDIESWHKINKRVRSCATSFLGGRHKNANTSFTAQQLGWHRRTVGSPLPL